MRKKLQLTKSLLVAACLLLGGVSAWATETPVWSMDFSTVSPSNSSAIVNFTNNGDYQKVGQDGWNWNSVYATETGTHFAWARVRTDAKTYGFCFRNSAVFCQNTSYAMTIIGLQNNYKVTVVTSANGIASSFKGNYGGTWTESVNAANTTYTYTMSSAGDLNLMVAAAAYVYSVTVVEVSGLESTTYTVKYQNAGGTDLKDPVIYNTYVNETYTASAADMATFYSVDTNKKYVYASGNESKVATATAGNNVITLVFDEYNKVAYSVTAKNGAATLGVLAEGEAYTDGSTIAKWSKYINVSDQWYETTGDYAKSITAAGNTDVTFAPSQISYFYEFETLTRDGGSAVVTETGASNSNNAVGRIANSSGGYATLYTPALAAGKYILSMPYYCSNSVTADDVVYVYVTNNVSSLGDAVKTFNIEKTNTGLFTTYIEVPEGCFVAFQGAHVKSSNSKARIDYLTLAPAVAPATIPASGFATIASDCALDCANLPSGVKAYKVSSISASAVTLEQVTTAVAAGTGLILEGTAGSYNIPVVASGTDISSTNKLQAAVKAKSVAADAAYILKGGKFCLVTAASSVPAGKAYLLASDVPASASELNIEVGGEATGIDTIAKSQELNANCYYDLQGRRVAQPTKGLYIVNGRKMIIK